MKILYHHRTAATDAQRVHILEIVRAFRTSGHEVEIVSLVETEQPNEQRDEASDPPWKVWVNRIPFAYELVQLGYNLIGFWMVFQKLRRGGFEFVYERYSLFNFAGVLAARMTGKPLILEVNSPFALEQGRDKAIRAVRFAAWTERVICNLATRVIVVTQPLCKILIENGIDASRLVVMTNGVNPEHLRAGDGAALRESLKLNGKVVIGFVGWFKRWHGLEFLIEAFHEAGLRDKNAVVLMIGDGPAMAELKSLVEARGLGESVIFAGAIPHERIAPYLDLIDIAVQPAANEYCCPMKILEYMALAKPIVAPRQDNIEELVEDGNQALLFPPRDTRRMSEALSRLATDPELRSRMGTESFRTIERRGFLWTRNAQAVLDMVAVTRQTKRTSA